MPFFASCIVLIGAMTAQTPRPVVLENAYVRLELDPRTFSARFAGFPGGKNFLDVIHLTPSEIAAPGWLEPGGCTTDVLPDSENSALLRRGPAEIIVQEAQYVLLLSPVDPERGWRIKKEYFLVPDTSEARYKVTVLSSRKEERPVGIRTTTQFLGKGQLRVPAVPDSLGLLGGTFPGFANQREAPEGLYVLPLDGSSGRHGAVLAARASAFSLETDFGRWTRHIEIRSAVEENGTGAAPRFVALLDDRSHVYQGALEVMQAGVNVGAPLVVEERWIFAPPGESAGAE